MINPQALMDTQMNTINVKLIFQPHTWFNFLQQHLPLHHSLWKCWHQRQLLFLSLFKVYAKLLAKHLLDSLPTLIKPDQKGFTKGTQASDATKCILNLIYHTDTSHTLSLLLSIDAEKEFDRVHWFYISQIKLDLWKIISQLLWLYYTP